MVSNYFQIGIRDGFNRAFELTPINLIEATILSAATGSLIGLGIPFTSTLLGNAIFSSSFGVADITFRRFLPSMKPSESTLINVASKVYNFAMTVFSAYAAAILAIGITSSLGFPILFTPTLTFVATFVLIDKLVGKSIDYFLANTIDNEDEAHDPIHPAPNQQQQLAPHNGNNQGIPVSAEDPFNADEEGDPVNG